MFHDHRVVFVIYEIVVDRLVHRDPELAGDIVAELIIISIKMILCDIGQYCYIGTEGHDIVQLKTTDLHYIPWFRVFRHLAGEGVPDIACQRRIQSAMPADMPGQGRGRAFSVAAGDTDDTAIAFIPVGELDLADHRNAFGTDVSDDLALVRDARAFHDLVGVQEQVFGMFAFFEGDVVLLQGLPVVFFQRAGIGYEHIIAALGREDCRTYTAFATTEYDQSL